MADEAQTDKTDNQEQTTSAGDGKNTGSGNAGAGTQTADKPEAANKDITQTAEFKAALTAAIEKKLPQLRKQIAKEVSGEKEGEPSVDELKGRAETAESKLRVYEAREQVEDYVSDKRNNVPVKNVRALYRLIRADFAFGDDGKVTNLKDLIQQAKTEAPELFGSTAGSADGGAGSQSQNGAADMNALIRQAAGR